MKTAGDFEEEGGYNWQKIRVRRRRIIICPASLDASRYLIILPIIGLLLAASTLFVFGGIGMIAALVEGILGGFQATGEAHGEVLPIEVEIVEYVHRFLIGTWSCLYGSGLIPVIYRGIEFPSWLRIDSTEELETNLIGVTVVVLAVQFMGVVFTHEAEQLMQYGIGISLPIAALSLFIGLRTMATSKAKMSEREIELIDKYGEEIVETAKNKLENE